MSEEPMMGQAYFDFWKTKLPQEGSYTVRDESLAVDGGNIILRVVTPAAKEEGETFPVLVWYHGGGWARGSIEVDTPYLTTISTELNVVVVNVDYRLAPKFPFPHGFNDCLSALKWVVRNAAALHVSPPKGLIVGGDSAGGNLAAAVVQETITDPLFSGANAVTGHYVREPALVHPDFLPEKYKGELRSEEEDMQNPGQSRERNENFYKMYAGPKDDPRVSPLLSPHLPRMPRAYIQVNERDILRDHGVLYEKILRAEGIPTKLDSYLGAIHGGHYWVPDSETAAKLDRDCRAGLRWLLGRA